LYGNNATVHNVLAERGVTSGQSKTLSLDVTNIKGNHNIAVMKSSQDSAGGATVYIYDLWLEE